MFTNKAISKFFTLYHTKHAPLCVWDEWPVLPLATCQTTFQYITPFTFSLNLHNLIWELLQLLPTSFILQRKDLRPKVLFHWRLERWQAKWQKNVPRILSFELLQFFFFLNLRGKINKQRVPIQADRQTGSSFHSIGSFAKCSCWLGLSQSQH